MASGITLTASPMPPPRSAARQAGRSQAYKELKAWLRTQSVPQQIRFLNDLAVRNERFSLRLTNSAELPRDALIQLLLQRLTGSHQSAHYVVKCFEAQLGKRRFWRLVRKNVDTASPMFLALDLCGGGVLSRQVVAKPQEQAPVPYFGVYIAVLALALAFFTISTAPAWLLASVAGHVSRGTVLLERPEGSFWKGKAAYVTYMFKDGSGRRLENFTWDVLPARLLRGEVAARVTLADSGGTVDTIVGLRGSRPFLADMQASFPAALTRGFVPLLDLWSPGGVVRVDAERVNLNPLQVAAPGKISWTGATLTLSPVSPLGDYEVQITPDGDKLTFGVTTANGALQVTGGGQYVLKTGGEFRGKAQAAPAFVVPMQPLLEIMGPATSDGGSDLRVKLPALPY